MRAASGPPNIIFILTDDQRWDALGCAGNSRIRTPHMDSISARGVRFSDTCVTMSVCSASRAAILTGNYGSRNGVMGLGGGLRPDAVCFARDLQQAGYRTGYVGKWHLKPPDRPEDAGFDQAVWFYSNGAHFDRKVTEYGQPKVAKGFLEDYLVEHAIRFLRGSAGGGSPFFLHLATQLPHLDHEFRWHPKPATLAAYDAVRFEPPPGWNDSLRGKPAYLKDCRNRTQALDYRYDDPDAIRRHIRQYYATITDLDACIGRVLATVRDLGLERNTVVALMGDNGWLLGEHGFTSKVLPYEESVRVPFIMAGPEIGTGVSDACVLNIDVAPTLLDLAGVGVSRPMHGRSLRALLERRTTPWRKGFLYEALQPELGSRPVLAIRERPWKLIQTFDETTRSKVEFEELYDLENDPAEMRNLAQEPARGPILRELRSKLIEMRAALTSR